MSVGVSESGSSQGRVRARTKEEGGGPVGVGRTQEVSDQATGRIRRTDHGQRHGGEA